MDEKKSEDKPLTKKQKAFCLEYIKNGYNATQAAKKAGYAGGYGTLRGIGSKNLTKDNIRKRIEQHFEDKAMGANEVLERLGDMARGFDVTKYIDYLPVYTKKGNAAKYISGYKLWLDMDKLQADGYSHLIKKIKETANGIELEWHDQAKALELIGKHHALFTEKIELGGRLDLTGISDDGAIAAAAAIIDSRKKNTTEGN